MGYEKKFILSLLLTLIIEVPVIFILIRYFCKNKNIKTKNIVFVGVLASSLTLPYLWFVLPAFIFNRTIYIILGESLVVLVEAIIYLKLLKLKIFDSFIISLFANLASVIVGLLIKI